MSNVEKAIQRAVKAENKRVIGIIKDITADASGRAKDAGFPGLEKEFKNFGKELATEVKYNPAPTGGSGE